MLSKEKFIEYITELKKLTRIEEKINDNLKLLSFDHGYLGLDRHVTLIISLLEDAMNDKERLISTYIYETDWGRVPSSNTKNYGMRFYNIDSFESLYDFIKAESDTKVFVISDTHFNHNNIIKYCNRPYKSVEEMNEDIIKRWNSVVRKNDVVFHLGDLGMGDFDTLKSIVDRLNGRKALILGNHDIKRNEKFYLNLGFDKVYKDFAILGGIKLSHYPKTLEATDLKNVYGHIHNTEPSEEFNDKRHECVSVEKINYTPVEIKNLFGGDEK